MPNRLPFRSFSRTCLAVAALAISGCGPSGPKDWPVTGKVTFRGQPVSAASIRFSNPQAGVDVMATLDDNGEYTVVTARGPGLPEGTYQAAIMPTRQGTPVGTPMGEFVKTPEPVRPDIPQKYSQPTTSALTMVVKSEANVFDVDMLPSR